MDTSNPAAVAVGQTILRVRAEHPDASAALIGTELTCHTEEELGAYLSACGILPFGETSYAATVSFIASLATSPLA